MKTPTEELLENWYRRLRESQFSHYESAKMFDRMNYWLGIPSVTLSAIVGTSIFATMGESVKTSVRLLVGLISVLAATLTGLQTFLKFSERAEKHRSIAARYGSLRREIEELLSSEVKLTRELVTPIREAIDRLAEEAPNVPTTVWSRTQQVLAKNTTFLDREKMQDGK